MNSIVFAFVWMSLQILLLDKLSILFDSVSQIQILYNTRNMSQCHTYGSFIPFFLLSCFRIFSALSIHAKSIFPNRMRIVEIVCCNRFQVHNVFSFSLSIIGFENVFFFPLYLYVFYSITCDSSRNIFRTKWPEILLCVWYASVWF